VPVAPPVAVPPTAAPPVVPVGALAPEVAVPPAPLEPDDELELPVVVVDVVEVEAVDGGGVAEPTPGTVNGGAPEVSVAPEPPVPQEARTTAITAAQARGSAREPRQSDRA